MQDRIDGCRSLRELESDDWGESTHDSHLVMTCHRLRRKPLIEFTIEDLRIMIGQAISLPILIPLALERLEEDPLGEGDFYPGDLLAVILRTDDSLWEGHPDALHRIRQVVRRVKESVLYLDETGCQTISNVLDGTPRSVTE